MKLFVRAACVAAASAVLISSATAANVVNVYTARHYDTDAALLERFTEQTGIEVNLIEGKSDALLERLVREGDRSPADVFITVDAGRLHRAVEAGVLSSVESPVLAAAVPASARHPDGLWYGLAKRARVLVVSRERVPDTVETLDYEMLALPEWRGRVLSRSSSNIYTQSLVASMIETRGDAATEAWCEGIVANFARRPQGGDRDQIRAVAAGEGDVAIVNHYYYLRMLEGNAADRAAAESVRVIFPNQSDHGTHVNFSGGGVVARAPNRENAVALLEFLVQNEAQSAFAAGNQEFPVVEGAATTSLVAELGPFVESTVNAEALGLHNAAAVRMMDRAGWR